MKFALGRMKYLLRKYEIFPSEKLRVASLRKNHFLFKEPLAATTLTFAAGKYFIAKLFHIAKRYFTNPVGIYIIVERVFPFNKNSGEDLAFLSAFESKIIKLPS